MARPSSPGLTAASLSSDSGLIALAEVGKSVCVLPATLGCMYRWYRRGGPDMVPPHRLDEMNRLSDVHDSQPAMKMPMTPPACGPYPLFKMSRRQTSLRWKILASQSTLCRAGEPARSAHASGPWVMP